MRSVSDSTDAFEAWMRRRTDVSRRLLKKKHELMREGPFPFLRATFYRWVERWPKVCPELAGRGEDVLLTVGDLGRETANIHLGSRTNEDLADRLGSLDRNGAWFAAATERMVACTLKDHAKWAKH